MGQYEVVLRGEVHFVNKKGFTADFLGLPLVSMVLFGGQPQGIPNGNVAQDYWNW